MSKIAEKKALEAYHIYNCYNEQCMMQEDINLELRIGYEEGYDQAMQDFMEKAKKWIEYEWSNSSVANLMFGSFKNYMQNE